MMRKGPVVRRKISKAAVRFNGREAGRIDGYTRRKLRSSSSLSVVAI